MIKPELLVPQISTVGLVAHYKLWAGLTSTASVFDYSLGGKPGTPTGTDIAPAFPGFTCNGIDDFIDVGTGPTAVNSVLMWVKLTSIASTEHILGLQTGIYLRVAIGAFQAPGFTGGTTILYNNGIATPAAVKAETWHFVGVTDTVAKDASDFDIGRANPGAVAYMEGVVGDVFLFSRVLTAADVISIYSLTRWRYGV